MTKRTRKQKSKNEIRDSLTYRLIGKIILILCLALGLFGLVTEFIIPLLGVVGVIP